MKYIIEFIWQTISFFVTEKKRDISFFGKIWEQRGISRFTSQVVSILRYISQERYI